MNEHIPFQTPNLVWDSTIAIYLFLLGISSGAVQLAIAYRNSFKIEKPSENWMIRSAAILGTIPTLIGLTLLVFHLTKPWTFWKLMFNYNGTSVMSMGVMLFQAYMAVLVVWIAIMFKDWLAVLINRYLPMFKFILPWIDFAESKLLKPIEFVLFTFAAVLGAYTGFLLPIMVTELGLLVAFFVGLHFGGADKQLALHNALTGTWGMVFWVGVFLIGILIPLIANLFGSHTVKYSPKFIILVSIFDLIGVFCLRFFILYAGQLTISA